MSSTNSRTQKFGKDKKAIIVLSAVIFLAIALVITMACCIPREMSYESKSGNIIDVITLDSGKWLYATSDGSVVCMNKSGVEESSYNIVETAKSEKDFDDGILKKIYKANGSDSVYAIVMAKDLTSLLLRLDISQNGLDLIECVQFVGNVDNTYFLEKDGFLYLVCTGQQIAEIMRYKADGLEDGVLNNSLLFTCHTNSNGKIKLRAVQMSSGVNCFESDGKFLYIIYDGGIIRIANDFSGVKYESTSREYFVDGIDTEKYFSFGLYGVSSRGSAFVKEENRFYVVDRSSEMYSFATSDIDALEIGEDLECKIVPGISFEHAPASSDALNYDEVTKIAYVRHESSDLITKIDFTRMKIDFSFGLESKINKIVQKSDGNEIFYLYKNIHKTGQSEKTILSYTNVLSRKYASLFTALLISGVCIAVLTGIALAILCVVVVRGTQQQAIKVVRKIRRQKWIYIALLPSFILLMAFCYYEAIASIGLSFFDYTLTDPSMIWNNFANYKEVFSASQYAGEAFGNMVLFLCFDLFVSLVPPLLFGFFLSVMKWQKLSNAVRTMLFITGVVPSVAGLLIWRTGIYGKEGVLNLIIVNLFGGEPIGFLTQTAYAKWSVLFIGFPFVGAYLIFYGGMMNIPSSYYEAAELEGIGIWKRFFYIDIPLIVPQVKYVFITSFIYSMQNFSRTYMVTDGKYGTYTPIHRMYIAISETQNYGLASAYATIIFILLFFATFINLRKQKRSLED